MLKLCSLLVLSSPSLVMLNYVGRFCCILFSSMFPQLLTPLSLALHPMSTPDRKNIHAMANSFGLKSVSNGNGANRRPILSKTKRTRSYELSNERFDATCRKHFRSLHGAPDAARKGFVERAKHPRPAKGKTQGTFASVAYKEGEIVGAAAPEIDITNRGRSMLEKMGWTSGNGLGAENNKGELAPISQSMKKTRAGLE